ncbi:MAG: hypothetical protein OXU63_05845, partial [Acidobacteriota bacterium]|nr:hypothetical protein [Acidobacteriota bacterium]
MSDTMAFALRGGVDCRNGKAAAGNRGGAGFAGSAPEGHLSRTLPAHALDDARGVLHELHHLLLD